MNTICLGGRVYGIKKINTSSGTPMSKFRLQISRYKGEAFYVDVVSFDKNAEFVEKHVKEGSGVVVSGKIDEETWDKDGITQRRIKVISDRVDFLPIAGKKSQDEPQQSEPKETTQQEETVF